ncbi:MULTISPECIES: hypothetical protein [unclassified Isoptericola]|uniref:hypothetical protein n=1 Tax=unclassified Isoptericola TaxID=2623355 RepID=UPI002712DF86|nr:MULTISPECIES: hypothetical protein [unclassified Isoptericola]MDO8145641.1 hypothetical protein [Isoptericola sp. 178]MDO8152116.1 hypothetical protein [Isoptericola sp. b408]
MDDEDYVETQYSEAAKDEYRRRADEFVAALREHVELVLTRKGREREIPEYFGSTTNLENAAEAFNDAEFEWCGSFPLALASTEDDDDDLDEEEEPERPLNPVVTMVGRWDFRVTDEDALIESGRAAYLDAWPDEDREDAEARVRSLVAAAAEVSHRGGPGALEMADGLEPERATFEFVLHEGGDDDEFDDDPFAIVHRS